MARTIEDVDAQAARAKVAFYAHLTECAVCAKAWWQGVNSAPDKENLCARGHRRHRIWWALEEA